MNKIERNCIPLNTVGNGKGYLSRITLTFNFLESRITGKTELTITHHVNEMQLQ